MYVISVRDQNRKFKRDSEDSVRKKKKEKFKIGSKGELRIERIMDIKKKKMVDIVDNVSTTYQEC